MAENIPHQSEHLEVPRSNEVVNKQKDEAMSKNTGAILEESPVAKAITIRGTKIK
jgi:hypothetical protein